MRAFVSVDVPPPHLPGVRATSGSAPSHLTLLFLGELPEEKLPGLTQSLARAIEIEGPFQLRLRGLGAFPSFDRPKILFARIEAGAEALGRLHERLVEVAHAHGVSVDDRPFVPHMTMMRIRSPHDSSQARELLTQCPDEPFGEIGVTELHLKSSVLTSAGATHRVEARFPLRGPARPTASDP